MPPIDKRFPVNRPYAPHKGCKGPYLTPLLKRMLEKKIKFEDPETQKIIKGTVKDAILWRLILNASQGDNHAIIHVLDRIDGKVAEVIKQQNDDPMLDNEVEIVADGHGREEVLKKYKAFIN